MNWKIENWHLVKRLECLPVNNYNIKNKLRQAQNEKKKKCVLYFAGEINILIVSNLKYPNIFNLNLWGFYVEFICKI